MTRTGTQHAQPRRHPKPSTCPKRVHSSAVSYPATEPWVTGHRYPSKTAVGQQRGLASLSHMQALRPVARAHRRYSSRPFARPRNPRVRSGAHSAPPVHVLAPSRNPCALCPARLCACQLTSAAHSGLHSRAALLAWRRGLLRRRRLGLTLCLALGRGLARRLHETANERRAWLRSKRALQQQARCVLQGSKAGRVGGAHELFANQPRPLRYLVGCGG